MTAIPSLPWTDPLALAASVREPYWVLLYSGAQTAYSGRYSLLACDLIERVEAGNFAPFAVKLTDNQPKWDNSWFGYLGYGLKNSLERLPQDEQNWLHLPDLCMMRFGSIYVFDHEKRELTLYSAMEKPVLAANALPPLSSPKVSSLRSNMSKDSYICNVNDIIARIHAGELYQANLTRKWFGEFEHTPAPFELFRKLCAVSPAPYSAFLQLGDTAIASSSPELFLKIDANGAITTRPIKGTAPRYADEKRDHESYQKLKESAKDRAENLMIVDLMRNDLSRSGIPGSVEVSSLFDVTSYATIHHLSSTIIGKKRSDCTTLQVISRAFPPGSMTGAPKIRAMQLCSELERLERGVYSGAIGWLGGDGSAELSVVIRTLLVQGKHFEFQVGGGIVADSQAEAEWQETLDKSKGILTALGIAPETLG